MEMLERHSKGVIALTGCLASRFCQRLVEGRDADARAHADDLLQAFGPDNVFFEVQKNGIADQDKANEGIVRIAREVNRPLVGTGDVHYLRREDYHHHTALLCVQTKSTLAAPKMTFDTNEFYLRSNDEMADKFAAWPEALQSTLDIAERCNVDIELGKQLIPHYPTPDGVPEHEYLRARVEHGLAGRYGDPVPAAASERLEFERAANLRDKLHRLESLKEQFIRFRFAVETLSFVYPVAGYDGDDRVYVIRRGRVRAESPAPHTVRERAQLRRAVAEVFERAEHKGAQIPTHEIDELLLLSSWFRRYPGELARTTAPEDVIRPSVAAAARLAS